MIRDIVQILDSFTATRARKPERTTPTFRAVGLGPFDEFEIRLRPLTVLIGKNSVGKSLAMTAMWLLASARPEGPLADDNFVRKFAERRDETTLRDLIIHAAYNYLKAIAEGVYKASREITALRGSRLEITGATGRKLEIEVAEKEALIRRDDITPIFAQVEVIKDGSKFRVSYGYSIDITTESLVDVVAGVTLFVHLVYHLELYPWHGLYLPPFTAPHFLVDGRSGLIRAARPWARLELGFVDIEYLRSYYMLSEEARSLKPSEVFQGFLKELGVEKVEAVVESGYVRLYVELWNGVKMPIERAPSGIREALLPAIALEAWPNVLFIEEPEAHLHPAAIVKFAELLAHSVNRGDRWVVLSTHSDFLLSKLDNLVKASILDKDKLRKLGLSETSVLPREKIAVYLVKADRERKRSTVEELPVDEEGISEYEFSKVSEELLNESSDITLLRT
ncbi:MAG: AAA family ATPase [Thermoproteus sp.]